VQLYRGYTEASHCENFLDDYNYHYGVGVFNSGTYFSDNKNLAIQYTSKFLNDPFDFTNPNENNVISVKLDPFAKMVKDDYLAQDVIAALIIGSTEGMDYLKPQDKNKIDTFINFYNNINNPMDAEFFLEMFKGDAAKIGVYLGYDGMYQNMNSKCYIIFNRSKLFVSEEEYNRVKALAKSKENLQTYQGYTK
jgi:hypothetical protein